MFAAVSSRILIEVSYPVCRVFRVVLRPFVPFVVISSTPFNSVAESVGAVSIIILAVVTGLDSFSKDI